MTSDFCNFLTFEIRLLHLANYCFTDTVIGKPLLKCLKAGSGDDALLDCNFSYGLYLVPNFVVGSSVVLYREIKWTTRPQIRRSTAKVLTKKSKWTFPFPGLKRFGLKSNFLSFALKLPGLVFVGPSAYSQTRGRCHRS